MFDTERLIVDLFHHLVMAKAEGPLAINALVIVVLALFALLMTRASPNK
jgi:hypothetical protein